MNGADLVWAALAVLALWLGWQSWRREAKRRGELGRFGRRGNGSAVPRAQGYRDPRTVRPLSTREAAERWQARKEEHHGN